MHATLYALNRQYAAVEVEPFQSWPGKRALRLSASTSQTHTRGEHICIFAVEPPSLPCPRLRVVTADLSIGRVACMPTIEGIKPIVG
jgi:hypothetical protein